MTAISFYNKEDLSSNNIPAEFQGIVIEEEIVGRALAWYLKNKDEVHMILDETGILEGRHPCCGCEWYRPKAMSFQNPMTCMTREHGVMRHGQFVWFEVPEGCRRTKHDAT